MLLPAQQYDHIKEYMPEHVIISSDRYVMFGMLNEAQQSKTEPSFVQKANYTPDFKYILSQL